MQYVGICDVLLTNDIASFGQMGPDSYESTFE